MVLASTHRQSAQCLRPAGWASVLCGLVLASFGLPCAAQGLSVATSAEDLPTLALQMSGPLNTRLLFEPRVARQQPLLGEGAGVNQPTRSRLTLEFPSSKPSRRPSNLLRVQLSGDAVLNLRPRSGGLAVSYQARF